MLRQSSSRGHRSKKLRASHSFQAFLLVAVAIWIVYQLTHSFGERRRPVSVETGSSNGTGPARRRLGRKGFVHFAGRASVVDGIAGVSGWSDGASSDDHLSSKAGASAGDGDGDGEDREAGEGDEDDGGVDGDVDDADDGLAVAVDEEEDDIDFQAQDGSREDEPKSVRGGTQNRLNRSVVPPLNGTGTVKDGAAVLLRNATGGAANGNGTVPTMSGSASGLNNISSVDVASLRDRGTAGDVANSLAVGAAGAEEKPTSTDNSGHGIST